MPAWQAIVFDFDGVIAQSMQLHAEAYRQVLGPYGVEPSDRDIFLQEGARSETIIRDALRSQEHPTDDATVGRLSDAKQAAFQRLGPPSLYPGAKELVQAAHDTGLPLALVTGTRRENLKRLIPDLLPLFTAVLAQDAYSQDKPDPEPYTNAAARLDVPAAQCICIENAIRGIQSAKAAGYGHVIAIASTLDASDLVGADEVVPDAAAARTALQRLLDES